MVGARADDWPQWRGALRDGIWCEEGVLQSFPADGLKIVWRVPVGPGWASPTIAGGKVFLADSELNKPHARERVRCFDAATGKELWSHAYEVNYPEWAFSPDQNAGPTATPAVVEDRVYALGASGEIACLATTTGAVIWRKDLGKEYEVPPMQTRASPLIENDLLILNVGAKPGACVMALDRHTGREVWTALSEPVGNSSPIVIIAGGQRQLIVWTGDSVTSLNPSTGGVWWREAMNTSNNDDNATPVWDGDRLLISGLMFKLAANKPAATVVWPENRGVSKRILSNISTPLLFDDTIYSATNRGDLVCLDAVTGRELWKTDKVTDRKTGSCIHITPNGQICFLFTNLGDLIVGHLTRAGYKEIGRARLIEPVMPFGGRKVTWSPPAYANRHIFVRNEKELVCALLAAP